MDGEREVAGGMRLGAAAGRCITRPWRGRGDTLANNEPKFN